MCLARAIQFLLVHRGKILCPGLLSEPRVHLSSNCPKDLSGSGHSDGEAPTVSHETGQLLAYTSAMHHTIEFTYQRHPHLGTSHLG